MYGSSVVFLPSSPSLVAWILRSRLRGRRSSEPELVSSDRRNQNQLVPTGDRNWFFTLVHKRRGSLAKRRDRSRQTPRSFAKLRPVRPMRPSAALRSGQVLIF